MVRDCTIYKDKTKVLISYIKAGFRMKLLMFGYDEDMQKPVSVTVVSDDFMEEGIILQ